MKSIAALLLSLLSASALAQSPFDGDWRGQAQFQATIGGKVDQAAHSVVALTLAIDPQGKVTGASPGNGCKLLGIVSPGVVDTNRSIDVTFSGCQYQAYNRRFSGYLTQNPKDKYLSLTLNSLQMDKPPAVLDVKATLRR